MPAGIRAPGTAPLTHHQGEGHLKRTLRLTRHLALRGLRGVGDGRAAGSLRILRRSGLISVLRAQATASSLQQYPTTSDKDFFGSPPSDPPADTRSDPNRLLE